MNDDYLWDKSGADAEIEKLETQLRMFRYQATAPPALSSGEPTQRASRNYRNLYAVAACIMLMMILLGVWLQSSIKTNTAQKISAELTMPDNDLLIPNDLPVPGAPAATPEKIVASKRFSKAKTLNHKKIERPITPSDKLLASNHKPLKQPAVTLTKKEKYAYDQLMLALSITSSKLKMVKDKAAGLEYSTAVYEDGDKFLRRK